MRTAALLWTILVVGSAHLAAADAKFGGALDASKVSARAEADAGCNARPLTVECWAKVAVGADSTSSWPMS